MKLKNLMGAMLALAGLAFGGVATAGDVWEFIPDSPTETNYVAGTAVQFRMRLLTRNWSGPATDLAPWTLVANTNSLVYKTAEILFGDRRLFPENENLRMGYVFAAAPLSIGIVANGKTLDAPLTAFPNATHDNYGTDFSFSYTVQTGDYALPLRLAADANGNPINNGISDNTYFFRNLGGKDDLVEAWKITTANGDEFTAQMVDQATAEKQTLKTKLPREVIPFNADGDYLRA